MSFTTDPASIKVCSIVLAFCLIALAGLSSHDAATAQSSALVINEYLADPPDTITGDANGDGSR
ncbi:MAG TPA: hypothetical protein VLD57_00015, partial [Blastocatellia bacterium]|nr:hypothetical protein [Blastocatellia bacterium]